jgi:hypothetical protein
MYQRSLRETIVSTRRRAQATPFRRVRLLEAKGGDMNLQTDGSRGERYGSVSGRLRGYGVAVLTACVALFTVAAVMVSSASAVASSPVVGWGSNSFGQTSVPTSLSGVTEIAAGGTGLIPAGHSLALRSDGTVVAWGMNSYGQTNVPTTLAGVTAIAAGGLHSLALRSDGTVVGWGSGGYGQTTPPPNVTGVTAVAAGFGHSLALKSDGTVVAWGAPFDGQTNVPAGLSDVVAIAAGGYHSLALKGDGTVVAWGYPPVSVVPGGLNGVIAIAAGEYHSLALRSDGTIVAWGANDRGQSTVPAGLNGVIAIAAGNRHSIALKADGTVVAWGSIAYVPAGLSDVLDIAAGGNHNLALVPSDTTPPELTVLVSPSVLWPPNHGYVNAQATVTATDDTDPNPTIEFVSVTSNEPDNGENDGNTVNDIVVVDQDTFELRAERCGVGSGRIYTITYQATDASGNSATRSATVTVPLEW